MCVSVHAHTLTSWTHTWPRNLLNSAANSILNSYTLGGEPGGLQEIGPVWPPDLEHVICPTCSKPTKKKNSINPKKISLNPLGCSDSSVSHFASNVSVKQMAWRVKQVLSCTVSGRTILISHEPMINGPLSAEAEWMWIEANAISAIEDFSLTGVYIKLSFPCTSCNSGRSYKDMILQ